MEVANTRESLILALKNDKNSPRWEEFVNQYWDYLRYAAYSRDNETGRLRFVPNGVDPDDAVEQTFWQLKNIILPDSPQFDVDFTEAQLAKKVSHGLKWRIFELEKGRKFRNYLLSVLRNVARDMAKKLRGEKLVFVENEKLERVWNLDDDCVEAADNRYNGCGEEGDACREWNDDIERFERGDVLVPGEEETENEKSGKFMAMQHAIEVLMSDARIARETKAIYQLLIEHAQNGRHGDGGIEAIAERCHTSPAAVYKHKQRMEGRLRKLYGDFLDKAGVEA